MATALQCVICAPVSSGLSLPALVLHTGKKAAKRLSPVLYCDEKNFLHCIEHTALWHPTRARRSAGTAG